MPYKTRYGSHYHMVEGCHGAKIPCDANGLEPCSDCCGTKGDGSGGGGTNAPSVGGAGGGDSSDGAFSSDVSGSVTQRDIQRLQEKLQALTSETQRGQRISEIGTKSMGSSPHCPMPQVSSVSHERLEKLRREPTAARAASSSQAMPAPRESPARREREASALEPKFDTEAINAEFLRNRVAYTRELAVDSSKWDIQQGPKGTYAYHRARQAWADAAVTAYHETEQWNRVFTNWLESIPPAERDRMARGAAKVIVYRKYVRDHPDIPQNVARRRFEENWNGMSEGERQVLCHMYSEEAVRQLYEEQYNRPRPRHFDDDIEKRRQERLSHFTELKPQISGHTPLIDYLHPEWKDLSDEDVSRAWAETWGGIRHQFRGRSNVEASRYLVGSAYGQQHDPEWARLSDRERERRAASYFHLAYTEYSNPAYGEHGADGMWPPKEMADYTNPVEFVKSVSATPVVMGAGRKEAANSLRRWDNMVPRNRSDIDEIRRAGWAAAAAVRDASLSENVWLVEAIRRGDFDQSSNRPLPGPLRHS